MFKKIFFLLLILICILISFILMSLSIFLYIWDNILIEYEFISFEKLCVINLLFNNFIICYLFIILLFIIFNFIRRITFGYSFPTILRIILVLMKR